MSIKCMLLFNEVKDFNNYTDILSNNWNIEKQLLKDRVETYRNTEFFKKLQNQFNSKELTIWPLKLEEVITWIDTMMLLRRIFNRMYLKGFYGEKFKIIMEYPLVFGNHMRADYLLIYERLIILLEFGMFNQDEKRSEERYTKKLQESINYRQIIGNLVDQTVAVINYTMIYRPEFDRYSKNYILDNIEYNNQEINLLTKFILKQLEVQDNLCAFNQLIIVNNI